MKRLFRSLATGLFVLSLIVPASDICAQGRRDNNNRGGEQSGRSGQRRGGNVRPSAVNNSNSDKSGSRGNGNNRRPSESRPGINDNRNKDHNHGIRPSGGSHGSRPDGNNHAVRPDGNNGKPSGSRPVQNIRPGNSNRPSGSRPDNPGLRPDRPSHGNPPVYRPQHREPSHGYGHAPVHGVHAWGAPPHRPYRPAPRPWSRPVPPPAFRPHYHITPLQAIIGVALGTALDISLNTLTRNNYFIDGYADNRVYLRNVNAMDYFWPDATLYYNNGYLASSTFSYSTSYYDISRYNSLFASLSRMYGAPAARRNAGSGWNATWWGYDNRYVTLEFQPLYTSSGGIRYYTTLVIGD